MRDPRALLHGVTAALDEEERELYITNATFKANVDTLALIVIPLMIEGAKIEAEKSALRREKHLRQLEETSGLLYKMEYPKPEDLR